MKRVGILLLLAALAAPAQMRSMGAQRGPGSMPAPGAGRGAGFSGSVRGTAPNWPNNGGWQRGTGQWYGNNNGGVRVGNWTFRTVPAQRGCPGFNCVSYPYYPSYYPAYSIPYVPTWGYSYGMQTDPPPAQQQPQYVYADNGASQSSSYDAGYAAAMAQVATSAAQQSRYGDHYLDSRERAPAPAEAAPSVSVTQGPATTSRNYTSQGTASISPATVLIFKDGHTSEIHNYAIIGQTLWNLSETQARKIPLSELDLDATIRANDDRGMTFKVPGSHD